MKTTQRSPNVQHHRKIEVQEGRKAEGAVSYWDQDVYPLGHLSFIPPPHHAYISLAIYSITPGLDPWARHSASAGVCLVA